MISEAHAYSNFYGPSNLVYISHNKTLPEEDEGFESYSILLIDHAHSEKNKKKLSPPNLLVYVSIVHQLLVIMYSCKFPLMVTNPTIHYLRHQGWGSACLIAVDNAVLRQVKSVHTVNGRTGFRRSFFSLIGRMVTITWVMGSLLFYRGVTHPSFPLLLSQKNQIFNKF